MLTTHTVSYFILKYIIYYDNANEIGATSIMACSPFEGYYKRFVKCGTARLYKEMFSLEELKTFARVTNHSLSETEIERRFKEV